MENNRLIVICLLQLLMVYSTDQIGINGTKYEKCREKSLDVISDQHRNTTPKKISTPKVFIVLPECEPDKSFNVLIVQSVKLLDECTEKGGKVDTTTEKCMKGNSTISTKTILISAYVSYYLTITGSFISATCLVLLLGTHFLFKELQTVHGKIIMALSSALGAFHVVQFIIAFKPHHGYCECIGIFLHYVLLNYYSWKLLACYDLWETFRKLTPVSTKPNSKRWKRLMIASVLLPTAIVLICVILEFGANVRLGYGAHGICFLTDKWSFLGAVVIPIILIMIWSFLFSIMAFRDIKRRMAESKKLRAIAVAERKKTQEGKVLLNLVLQMLILAGAGWLFGILVFFVESSFCMYVFLIMINFKGTFLLIVFCINKRTWKLYRQLYRKKLQTTTRNREKHHVQNLVSTV